MLRIDKTTNYEHKSVRSRHLGVSSSELVRLRWRNEKPDVSGYWLRFDGGMHADFVTEKDLKVESEQSGYLGQGMWCGPIEQPN
jgi:hypothetical protein